MFRGKFLNALENSGNLAFQQCGHPRPILSSRHTNSRFKLQDPKIQDPRSRNQDPEIKIQKSRSRNQDPEIKIQKSRSRNQDPEIKIKTDKLNELCYLM